MTVISDVYFDVAVIFVKMKITSNNKEMWPKYLRILLFIPLRAKRVMEAANLTERKNPHTPVFDLGLIHTKRGAKI